MWISRAWRGSREDANLAVAGPITQAHFLRALGLDYRADTLAKANPGHAQRLGREVRRLTHADEMGASVQSHMSVEPQPSHARGLLSASRRRQRIFPMRSGRACATLSLDAKAGFRSGVYASLNAGTGSNDDPDAVKENRRRIAAAFGRRPSHLVGVHQVHSPNAVFVEAARGARPSARTPMRWSRPRPASPFPCSPPIAHRCFSPIKRAGVIAAAHAGWKGATWRRSGGDDCADAASAARATSPPRSDPAFTRPPTKSGRNSKRAFCTTTPPMRASLRPPALRKAIAATSICPVFVPAGCKALGVADSTSCRSTPCAGGPLPLQPARSARKSRRLRTQLRGHLRWARNRCAGATSASAVIKQQQKLFRGAAT